MACEFDKPDVTVLLTLLIKSLQRRAAIKSDIIHFGRHGEFMEEVAIFGIEQELEKRRARLTQILMLLVATNAIGLKSTTEVNKVRVGYICSGLPQTLAAVIV